MAGSLPPALKRLGADVRMVLPLYRAVHESQFKMKPLSTALRVPLGNAELRASIHEISPPSGIPVYLIEREDLYDRPNLYGTPSGDYYDNLERFTFFAHAALRVAEERSFVPDVIHCHDWQTGLVPALLKGMYSRSPALRHARSLFTIHNIGYLGRFPADKFSLTGLSAADFFNPGGLEFWGDISLLKAGIVYSDAVTTVSPTYAEEIQTPEYGMGMEGILAERREHLHGILNGVDYGFWNPEIDKYLPSNYSLKNPKGKLACKKSLLREMGLKESLQDQPLLGMVSRLDTQKGLDLLVNILDTLMGQKTGLTILGSGDEAIQKSLHQAAKRHRGKVGIRIGFDEPLAHRLIAGADILLIPSRYEPCGLTQMYALKYGTVPVVRATGGLKDTIEHFDPKERKGNGFKFTDYAPKPLLDAVQEAIHLFHEPKSWAALMANGMKTDFSWTRSAKRYLELYRSVAAV